MVAKGAYRLRHVRPSVCPSFRTYQCGSHWSDILEIGYYPTFMGARGGAVG